ncbi:MAG: DUF1501 domain-containing protein [Chloroflexota bacterium]
MPSSSRRNFLKVGMAGAAAGLAAACSQPAPNAPAAPAPTSVPQADLAAPAMAGSGSATDLASPATLVPVPAAVEPAPTLAPVAATPVAAAPKRTLVVIQLSGGNDGLNSVVPYANGLYYQLRPQIGIAAEQVLRLDDQIGLHPNLKSFKTLYDQHQLAVIQGVGYPNASRSHFRSMEIWHTARPTGVAPSQGWLGAFMSEVYKVGDSPFQCVNFGSSVPQALLTEHAPIAALQDTSAFQFLVDRRLPAMKDPLVKAFGQVSSRPAKKSPALDLVASNWDTTSQSVEVLSKLGDKYQTMVQYPNNALGKTMQQVAQMLASNVGTRVFYVQLGGFDTHANQRTAQATLMSQLADSLAAFQTDLEGHHLAEQVLTISFSEFGRRVKENGSQGTDHGAAGPMFVVGKGVKGGVYGDHPDLGNLDEGDLMHTVDFRSVYATVIEDWLGAPAEDVLGAKFDKLGFVAA